MRDEVSLCVFTHFQSKIPTSLPPPFFLDDSASAASSMEVTDRIASLEQRVQMQEDDIQLLKSALADVVRRLNITEEQQAMQNKKGPTKGMDFKYTHSNVHWLVAVALEQMFQLHW